MKLLHDFNLLLFDVTINDFFLLAPELVDLEAKNVLHLLYSHKDVSVDLHLLLHGLHSDFCHDEVE